MNTCCTAGGRLFGGIYDDRFLVKPTPVACSLMPEAGREIPYGTAKPMLLVTDIDDRAFLKRLVEAMYEELPEPKRRAAPGHGEAEAKAMEIRLLNNAEVHGSLDREGRCCPAGTAVTVLMQ